MSRLDARNILVGGAYDLEALAEANRQAGEEALRQQMAAFRQQQMAQAQQAANRIVADAREQAKREADTILQEARTRAETLLNRANEQRATWEQEAYEQGQANGYHDGYEAGRAQAVVDTVDSLTEAQRVLDVAHQAQRRVLTHYRQDLSGLLSAIVHRVLGDTLAKQPVDALLALVDQAIDSLYLSGTVKVVVHPSVLETLRQTELATAEALERLNRLEWLTDASLLANQVFILSRDCLYDISPLAQADRLLEAVTPQLPVPDEIRHGCLPAETMAPPEPEMTEASLLAEEPAFPHTIDPTEVADES
ncbi:MAG: hypothetical protein SFZ03_05435 [Candidatus Melainabacteria bacterium]|nr:hypothetical protein [Candidatus Melainabacteria bacterium]